MQLLLILLFLVSQLLINLFFIFLTGKKTRIVFKWVSIFVFAGINIFYELHSIEIEFYFSPPVASTEGKCVSFVLVMLDIPSVRIAIGLAFTIIFQILMNVLLSLFTEVYSRNPINKTKLAN